MGDVDSNDVKTATNYTDGSVSVCKSCKRVERRIFRQQAQQNHKVLRVLSRRLMSKNRRLDESEDRIQLSWRSSAYGQVIRHQVKCNNGAYG